MRGAIREDDDAFKSEPNPKDDPFDTLGISHRVLNHFYDPTTMRGVNKIWIPVDGMPSPAWAIGIAPSSMFATMPEEDTGRSNHFTIHDAREAMYRALTGRSRAQEQVATSMAERKAYWATFFRALGNVLHLVQDTAQPQHTRNEPHVGRASWDAQPALFGHKSLFEAYVEARVVGGSAFEYQRTVDDKYPVNIVPGRPVATDGYPIPRFDRYIDYFSTAPSGGVATGVGLADYSNRGFFTTAKNFYDTTYALPSRDPADYAIVAVHALAWDGKPLTSSAPVYVYNGRVNDTANPERSATNVPLTSQSVWDDFLVKRGARPTFSLNYMNYDAAADLLLPRAVAYSAGLIDYFFRGQLEISLPPEGVYGVVDHAVENLPGVSGFRKIKLKLSNTTPPVVPSAGTHKGESIEQDMKGSIVAVVKFHENTCYKPDISGELGSSEVIRDKGVDARFNDPTGVPGGCRQAEEKIVVSEVIEGMTLRRGESASSFVFNFSSPIPINATDIYLQVIFRGSLGSERDAVVVTTKDVSEATHFSLLNVTDYLFCYNGDWNYKNEDGSLPAIIPKEHESALEAKHYDAARVAFGEDAGVVSGGSLTKPLVVATDLAPGRFARFAILTEPEVTYNDQIVGYYSPEPPPYKLHIPATNQLTVQGAGTPIDPYVVTKTASEVGELRKTKFVAMAYGYRRAGTGDCLQSPMPPASGAALEAATKGAGLSIRSDNSGVNRQFQLSRLVISSVR